MLPSQVDCLDSSIPYHLSIWHEYSLSLYPSHRWFNRLPKRLPDTSEFYYGSLCVKRDFRLFLTPRTERWAFICTYILQRAELWTEWSFFACLDMLPFRKQEMLPEQQPNNPLQNLAANEQKEARKARKSPNNTCYDTPRGSAKFLSPKVSTDLYIPTLHKI